MAKASTRTLKRKRIQVTIETSNKFWYNDGSIILQASNTQFRVHSSILSDKSTTFAQILAQPRPKKDVLVEGCPVVVCEGDSNKDWEHFLELVYHSTKLTRESSPASFEFLASTLRIATKYGFETIRDDTLARLKTDMPTQALNERLRWTNRWTIDQVINFINLALELKLRTMLPFLYFLCAERYPTKVILKGVLCPPANPKLSIETQHLVLIGRDKLRAAVMTDLLGWLFDRTSLPLPCKECPRGGSCCVACLRLIERYRTRCRQETTMGTTNIWEDSLDDGWFAGLCQKCVDNARVAYVNGRKKFWDAVPSFFDLPVWDQLKDFED